MKKVTATLALVWLIIGTLHAGDAPAYKDPNPQLYRLTARASEIDRRAKPHPEIDFVFEKDGKPADTERAAVDTRVAPQGRLVIWLMGYNGDLADRCAGYGLHFIQVHYANGWFGKLSPMQGDDDQFLGNIRLEAAIGEDTSPAIEIPKPDSISERAYQFVKYLSQKNPQGNWNQFLTKDGKGLQWDKVTLAGSSHGSTTAARFAKHQKVDRVVMFCGPRDHLDVWQGLPSATEPNRYFGFTHILDGGWTGDHYCRSWELLGLHEFGPIVDVDTTPAPFKHSRRLITAADVGNNANRAHSCVVPGKAAVKDQDNKYIHEEVWKYLFMHPVDQVGEKTDEDPSCTRDHRAKAAARKKP